MKLFTIGFTQTSAEDFFGRLMHAGVTKVHDARLNNTSQLAGFAKVRDLPWLLRTIAGIGYAHDPLLAPTPEMLAEFLKGPGSLDARWQIYAPRFRALMRARKIEEQLDPAALDGGCLLCSEASPHRCHRRLVAEYLAERWTETGRGPVEIVHL